MKATFLKVYTCIGLLMSCGCTKGAVTISPSGAATVCSGDQLELICTLTDTGGFALLVWNVTLIPKNAATPVRFSLAISSSSPSDQLYSRLINSTSLIFSRVSSQNSSPLISRLLFSPVSNHLNGTEVNCLNSWTSETSSVAVVNISNGNPIQEVDRVNLTGQHQFDKDGVILTLEWNKTDSTYSYRVTVTVHIVPNLSLNFSTSSRVHIKVPYNSPHNVSVLVSSCGKYDTIFFEEVSYSTCGNPQDQVSDLIRVLGFMEPAIEESTVIFHCPSQLVLNGRAISTCNRNGEWEPDPRNLQCLVDCHSPSPPPSGYILPTQTEGTVLSRDAMIIAVASSLMIIVVTICSIVFFMFGYFCGRYRKLQEQNPVARPPVYEDVLPHHRTEDLELKSNVAYAKPVIK